MHDCSPRIVEACGVPFFRTAGVPLRTQICDSARANFAFTRPAGSSGNTHSAPASFLCCASLHPELIIPGGQTAIACGKLSISHCALSASVTAAVGYPVICDGLRPNRSRSCEPGSLSWPTTGRISRLAGAARRTYHPGRVAGGLAPDHRRIALPQGSGRTDAGVHALAQVASFALQAPIPPGNLLRALNRTLPPSIRILEARTVRSTFHARHSAVAKTYEYRVFRGKICPPFWPAMFTPAPGRWTSKPCKSRPGCLKENTTF